MTRQEAPYRILIVDDEDAHRRLEKDILDSPEFEVSEAENGEQALELLLQDSFDVVLLDKRMPGIDGDEVCRRIRQDLNQTLLPVLMVTASNGREELLASMKAGASDFIRKPYNPLELLARTRNFAHSKRITDQLDSTESLLYTLARMVEARDEGTGDHCSRLSHRATLFGQTLHLSAEQIIALQKGGVLHDIGKLGIPDSILLKQAPLDEDEWQLMRQHTVIGAELLGGLRTMQDVLPIVRNHHERWDGGGYPDGLAGESIPYITRVFQLVDIHDALAFQRPYKPALSHEQIIRIFEEELEKGWRDPVLTNHFLDILRHDPAFLQQPMGQTRDDSEELFARIAATGVLKHD